MENKPKRTVPLNQPLTRFKNPSNRSQPATSPIGMVHLLTPNGQIITITADTPVVLGRGTASPSGERKIDLEAIPGASDGISRNHALIALTDGHLYITDYKSTNGTYLNKTELYPMRNYIVQDSDVLMLGKVKLRVKFVVAD